MSLRLRLGALSGMALASLGAAGIASAVAPGPDHVVQRVVLMRHGMRSPTKPPADLGVYSAAAWPSWPVEPGMLTPHGVSTLQSAGRQLGSDLAAAGLPADACTGQVRVIADSTPRNRASAEALLAGLSPSCPTQYQALPSGTQDPLFHGSTVGDDDDKAGINATDISEATHQTLVALQQVLLGCSDDACVAKARDGGKKVLLGGDLAKALKAAGSIAENLMLSYVQGMPAAKVGWGRLDPAGVARIITLHNDSFRLAHATPEASRGRGGNMLAHITGTLAATAGQPTAVPSLVPTDTKALVVIGHDTDLAAEAGLLGLGWHDATGADDYPPGGALIFDLVETAQGKMVRLSVAIPTLAGLRGGDMAANGAVARKVLKQPACGGLTLCPVAQFIEAAQRAVGNAVGEAGDEPVVNVPVAARPNLRRRSMPI